MQRYLRESLRADEHPGLAFVDGVGRRKTVLAGTRIELWQAATRSAAEVAELR